MIVSNQKQIVNLAVKNRLPTISPRGDFVESGGLMSYGPDEIEPYQRAAVMVDKILKGAKPADLPVEQPTKFELVINLKDRQGSWPDDSADRAHASDESHQVKEKVHCTVVSKECS